MLPLAWHEFLNLAPPGQTTIVESGLVAPGSSYPYSFYEKGSFGIHCGFHPGEHATVLVE
jgi:hypothetical protein